MTTTVTELAQDIGLARETDYYLMRDQLTEDELGLLYKVRQFAETEILPIASSYWERDEFPFELVPKLAGLNIVGDTMAGHGTTPMSAVGAGLVTYELSRVDGSIATFLAVHVGLAMQSINLLGSEEQRQRYLPPMAAPGKDRRVRATEPEHGSDSVILETSADATATSGCSTAASAGRQRRVVRLIVVYARDTADDQVKAFVVEKENPGYAATKITGKMSLRMVQNADITLTDCRVSEDARLANCNTFKDVGRVLKGTRNTVAWASAGHGVAAYDIALNYAQRRKQFGRPIAKTQLIQSMLVEMLGELTAMQLYCIRMARLHRRRPDEDTMAALAKYYCTVKGRTCAGWPATSSAVTVSCSTSTSCATCATWKPWSPTKAPRRSSRSSSAAHHRAGRLRLIRSASGVATSGDVTGPAACAAPPASAFHRVGDTSGVISG